MEQRFSVLTIGAYDLEAMRKFYEETFNWMPLVKNKDIVFYQMNGFLLSIGKRKDLAAFIGIPSEGNGFRGVTFGYNVPTEAEVQALYHKLKDKGVKLLSEPTKPPFGRLFFYFEDIEHNVLEIAFNPYVTLDEKHDVIDHQSIDNL